MKKNLTKISALDSTDEFPLEATRIETAGVLRCCYSSVAQEYLGKTVRLGDKSACRYCKQKFTLVRWTGEKPSWWTEVKWLAPVWKPDWQITA